VQSLSAVLAAEARVLHTAERHGEVDVGAAGQQLLGGPALSAMARLPERFVYGLAAGNRDRREEFLDAGPCWLVPGCPNVPVLEQRLARLLAGRPEVTVTQRVIADAAEAACRGCVGD
jgi:hypothetical protein